MTTTSNAEQNYEKAAGDLYAALFQMYQAEMFQEAYDAMGALLQMLIQDRLLLLEMYKDKIRA